MATNPKIPESLDPREPSHTGGLRPEPPNGGRNAVILAIVTALLLLGAIVYFMPRAPKATPAPAAADVPAGSAGMLQLSNSRLSMGPTGNSMYLQAMVHNTSAQTIDGIVAHVKLRAEDGSVSQAVDVPVQVLSSEGQARVGESIANVPIKPNETRPVRIAIDRVPQNWNHQMPEIQISAVTSHP